MFRNHFSVDLLQLDHLLRDALDRGNSRSQARQKIRLIDDARDTRGKRIDVAGPEEQSVLTVRYEFGHPA